VRSNFLSDLSSAAALIRSHDFLNFFLQCDAGGITAAAIVAKALLRENKEFSITCFPTLSEAYMQVIESTDSECTVVTDLGASYIKRFDAMSCDVIVLDHHTLGDQAERICYANPHLYGINGSKNGCGATMAFLLAITLNENNWDLSALAITGIAGDRQHTEGMKELNKFILDGAVKRGFVRTMPGSFIPVGNLSSELFISTDPYIVGVSAEPDSTAELLKEARIDGNLNSADLTDEESLRLSSLIALKLIRQGISREAMEECTRTRYYLPQWGTDAESLSSVINACGHNEKEGAGLAIALGDPKALDEAKRLDSESRRKVVEAVKSLVDEKKIHEMEYIRWMDCSNTGFTGMITSIVKSNLSSADKVVIGMNCSDEVAKVSSRLMKSLSAKGVNMSTVFKQACAEMGGEGGGHPEAAGGSFLSSRREEFLALVNRLVGEQLASNAE
ncbi:MAG: DHH family phosphoesterase, partial [archaeon]|nr:DHH family phosphoesterase [archaeon]